MISTQTTTIKHIAAKTEHTFHKYTNGAFKFKHVWALVMNNPKWKQLETTEKLGRTSKQSKLNTSSMQHFNVDLNSNNDEVLETRETVLPMDRDQTKRKEKASDLTSTTNTAHSKELLEIKDGFTELRVSLEKNAIFGQ
ncbi:hypothetical protein LXL04_023238 [Taraxacum kok-saghyz]